MNDDPDSSQISIAIAVEDPGWTQVLPEVEALARRAAAAALAGLPACAVPPMPAELSILLADDARLRDLNRRYRGLDRATNVLSFPGDLGAANGAPALLGDLALARETLVREAAEQSKPLADHLSHLVVHGVLHLLGYDHEEAAAAARMERLEIALLAGLGVPDPYRPPAGGAE